MKKAKFTAILSTIPCIILGNDLGSWNTIQAQKNLNGFQVGFSEESRIGTMPGQDKKLDELHSTIFANWQATDFMSLGIQDDFVLLRKPNHNERSYKRDNRPGINLAFSKDLRGFTFMNRSRFVMRDLENERPYFRYRNLSKATSPTIMQLLEKDLKLYVSYEWYFDEGSKDRHIKKNEKFNQFWTDLGIQTKMTTNLSASFFYRLVEYKSNSWQPSHVLGLTINLEF